MAEKIKNVNLRISVRLWERLLAVSGPLGYSRAAFIRLVLEGVAYSNNVSAYVPRKAKAFIEAMGQMNEPLGRRMETVPAAQAMSTYAPKSAPEPEPEYEEPPLRVATREDARHGEVTVSNFIVPLNWIDGEGNTRQQNLANGVNEYDGIYYTPPPLPKADADVPPDENTNGVAH
jgi:hypothetical protein